MSESINHSVNQFFQTSETNQVTIWMSDSMNHLHTQFVQKCWFIQKQIKWLSLSDSMTHFLSRFIKNTVSFKIA